MPVKWMIMLGLGFVILPLLGFLTGRHRANAMTFPWALIFQLIEHRRLCAAVPAEEVACGLDGCFGLSEATWKRISAAWEGDRLACAVGSGDFPFDPRADRGLVVANQAGGERSTFARGDAEG